MKYIKLGLVYGLLCGTIAYLWFLGVYYFNADPFYSFSIKLVIFLQLLFTFLAIWYFKVKINDNVLSFGEGLIVGLLVTLVSAFFSSTLIFISANYFFKDMVKDHVIDLYKYMISNKDALIRESSQFIYEGNYKAIKGINAFSLALDDFIWKIIRGTMFSILVSIALRRKHTPL